MVGLVLCEVVQETAIEKEMCFVLIHIVGIFHDHFFGDFD